MNLGGIIMNLTDSSTTPSSQPESSKKPPIHQQTLAGIKTVTGITMNPSDSSTKPSDSSTNQSESSTNPLDSSIINGIDENHLIEVPVDDLVTEGDLLEDENEDATVKEVHDSMKSPRPTLYEHTETPGGSVYWVPHVDERITVPEEGNSYDYRRSYRNVLRTIEDGSVVCTCRNFARFGFLCRHIFCVFKNRDINVIPEQYILRRWTRDIIPPELRRKRNRYRGKNVEVERLTNKATSVVDECLFMLGDNVEKMGDFVEKLKMLKTQVEAEVPNHPSIETGDVIGEHYAISKPNEKTVNNPTKVGIKGNIIEKERNKRRKSEKEKALGDKKKQKKKCGFCGDKTNLHTKTTCPKNPNARRKPKLIVS
ncbi:FAR1 DNA binding domain, Zinc finger, SWIM-type, MULE transposase domain, FHY3/FAR1 family [Artemisia annua]|uniref:FAR1 DNA binding domain, Zinc finger, SWIM-type, MULE transposase domain, FHY3/FAR1 family n=1 Tax=Artemisia annua TaxID=35608 RepID=A0A2U1KD04_ARTAN|nr:FAR1 DNA binding domain, Zinc finger, SWIM-type, MULE transposase domain, FHY3/FAR1 family [Artemisia annua]